MAIAYRVYASHYDQGGPLAIYDRPTPPPPCPPYAFPLFVSCHSHFSPCLAFSTHKHCRKDGWVTVTTASARARTMRQQQPPPLRQERLSRGRQQPVRRLRTSLRKWRMTNGQLWKACSRRRRHICGRQRLGWAKHDGKGERLKRQPLKPYFYRVFWMRDGTGRF